LKHRLKNHIIQELEYYDLLHVAFFFEMSTFQIFLKIWSVVEMLHALYTSTVWYFSLMISLL